MATHFLIESRYAGMWMLSNPFMLITVLFSFMPSVVPPSPTKCLAQAETFVLDERKNSVKGLCWRVFKVGEFQSVIIL